jgi:PAS domain S-box-containing protein
MKFRSLQGKMTLTFSLLAAILAASLAYGYFYYFRTELKTVVTEYQVTLVTSLAQEIDQKIATHQTVLKTLASSVQPTFLDDPAKAQSFLDHSYEAMALFDSGLSLFRPDGTLIAHTPAIAGLVGKNFSYRRYFQQTVKTASPCISSPFHAAGDGTPSIMFSVPLKDKTGRLFGVLGGLMNLKPQNFLGELNTIKIGRKGYLYLFDENRTLVMCPDRKRLLTQDNSPITSRILASANRNANGAVTTETKNASVLAAFSHLKATDWILAINFPATEAYAQIHRANRLLPAVWIVVVLLTMFVISTIMKIFITPLTHFTHHVLAMPQKNGTERLYHVERDDEVGALAQAFNTMVGELDQQQAALENREQLYKTVVEFTSEMSLLRGVDGTIHYVSPNCEHITGYRDVDFYARPQLLGELIYPDDLPIWREHHGRDVSEHESFDVRLTTRGGEIRWISHTCRPVYDEAGTLLGRRGNFSDVTERKRMERLLNEQNAFTRGLLASAAVPLFVIDREHRIIAWNRACEELTGLREADLLGTKEQWRGFYDTERPTLADLLIDNDLCLLPQFYATHASSTFLPDALQAEGWFANLGGQKRYVFFDAAPVYGPDGELVAAIETLQDITARKRLEEDVVRLRDFYLTLFEEFPTLVWRAGLDGQCNFFNKTWLEFTGRALAEEIAEGWMAGVHPEDREAMTAEFLGAIKRRQPLELEFRLRHRNGEYRNVIAIGRPYHDPDGSLAGYIGATHDITERSRAREKLIQLSQAIELSPSLVVITDLGGIIEYINPTVTRITGYQAEELIGKDVRLFGDGGGSDGQRAHVFTLLQEGKTWRGEYHNVKKDGESYWEAAFITPISNPKGETTHYLKVAEDVTERKRAELVLHRNQIELLAQHQELQRMFNLVEQAKKEWEQTMDCVGDLVVLTDKSGRIRRCNRATAELVGKEFQSAVGADWKDFLLTAEMAITMTEDDSGEVFHRPSGRWFELKPYPFFEGDHAEASGTVVTLHDTTELRKVTAALEAAYQDLKTTQSQMLQTEKMASIGQLAAGVAHEINNPIGFISSNLNTLQKYTDRMTEFTRVQGDVVAHEASETAREQLASEFKRLKLGLIVDDIPQLIAESLDGANRVRKIVQDLKTFSRVDEADYKDSDLIECLESTINIVWNELKYKVTLHKDYGEIPRLKCYPQQLNQVFMNLLVNGAQAIEKEGEITIRTWQEDSGIRISFTDTGNGIPEATLGRIFEPFFTTKEIGKGTGLGLSISYDIVKNHGGDIQVSSTEGIGTTFTIALPLNGGEKR